MVERVVLPKKIRVEGPISSSQWKLRCVCVSLFQASHIDTTHNEAASQPVGDCSSQSFTKKSDRSAQWPLSNVFFIRQNRLCTPLRNIIINFVISCNIFWVRWVCLALERVVHHKKLRGGGHNLFSLSLSREKPTMRK